jgi:hypothetical protein
MLTIEIRSHDTLNWGRKSALLMLAMTVFWTAMPASACLIAMPASGQRACCGPETMTLALDQAGMTANGSCCNVDRQNPGVTPVPLSSSERSQRLAFLPSQYNLQASTCQGALCPNALETPPPKSSLGGVSILRI